MKNLNNVLYGIGFVFIKIKIVRAEPLISYKNNEIIKTLQLPFFHKT